MVTSSPLSALQRLQVTASPALFARHVSRGRWKLAKHLVTLDEAITDTIIGKNGCRRLLINMPPRHGKSELTSGHLPTWHTGIYPDRSVMVTSYAASIANIFGRRNMALMDNWGPSLFGLRVNPRVSAAGEWELFGRRGGMVSRGIGGDQTGRGFHLGIIDDPIKNAEQAGSKTVRDAVWEWYQSTFYTRLEPDGAVIVIQTRWHMDDLTGRLLREMQDGGEKWRVVKMPAIGTDGAALWPERWSVERLLEIKRAIGSYYWAALYDQEPIPEGGRLFKRDWFEIVDAAPAQARRAVRFWDTASAEAGSDGDWSAGANVAEHKGVFYITDVQHGQWSPAARETVIESTAASDAARWPSDHQLWVEEEHGNSGKVVGHIMRQKLARFGCRTEVPTTNKVARSRPFQAQAEIKNVKLVRGNWNQRFLDELTAFPDGLHDDQVDAVSGAMVKLLASAASSGAVPKGIPAFNGRT